MNRPAWMMDDAHRFNRMRAHQRRRAVIDNIIALLRATGALYWGPIALALWWLA